MSQENVDVGLKAMAAFNERDAAAFGALLTPDAEVVPLRAATESTTYRGPDATLDFFSDTDESWAEVSVELDDLQDRGDVIVAFGRLRATGRSSGAKVETELAWVLRFRDGLISSHRTYTNRQEALEAAGLPE